MVEYFNACLLRTFLYFALPRDANGEAIFAIVFDENSMQDEVRHASRGFAGNMRGPWLEVGLCPPPPLFSSPVFAPTPFPPPKIGSPAPVGKTPEFTTLVGGGFAERFLAEGKRGEEARIRDSCAIAWNCEAGEGGVGQGDDIGEGASI
jgi:hypothetical protein